MFKYDRNTENKQVIQRVCNKANILAFKDAIRNVSWNKVLNETNNSEHAFNEFMKLFTETYNKHFPHKIKQKNPKINKTKSPWMTTISHKNYENDFHMKERLPPLPPPEQC